MVRSEGVVQETYSTAWGMLVICLGIPFPTRNMAKSLEKLLQLCLHRSYAWVSSEIWSQG